VECCFAREAATTRGSAELPRVPQGSGHVQPWAGVLVLHDAPIHHRSGTVLTRRLKCPFGVGLARDVHALTDVLLVVDWCELGDVDEAWVARVVHVMHADDEGALVAEHRELSHGRAASVRLRLQQLLSCSAAPQRAHGLGLSQVGGAQPRFYLTGHAAGIA
jgi:hypothetical protein